VRLLTSAPVRRWRARLSIALAFLGDRLRHGPLGRYIWRSRRVTGWTRGQEAVELARASHSLPDGAVIVEVGSFLGCSSVLLAGGRKVRGSGRVHCIDPFDASGDDFSVPVYTRIQEGLGTSLREQFDRNIRRAGLEDWVEVHQGTAEEVARTWSGPVDLLFLDGDQSYEAVHAAYASWAPFVRSGGTIAVHNTDPSRPQHESHDGSIRLVNEFLRPPAYADVRRVDSITFARKVDGGE
jgi:predicted O-methyltransferase YrrM